MQKEKLHAELKQVLSQKRSHLRESTCQLAQPEMDPEPTEEQTVSAEGFLFDAAMTDHTIHFSPHEESQSNFLYSVTGTDCVIRE